MGIDCIEGGAVTLAHFQFAFSLQGRHYELPRGRIVVSLILPLQVTINCEQYTWPFVNRVFRNSVLFANQILCQFGHHIILWGI